MLRAPCELINTLQARRRHPLQQQRHRIQTRLCVHDRMSRVQREAVRIGCRAEAREIDAQVLLGAVREDVRELVLLDGRLEERGRIGRLGEVVDCVVGPHACSVGAR